jgi:DNA-binding transcriptional ArsR family regulator
MKKQLLFEKQAEVVKAIAHPLRIAIVDFLKNGEQCVCDIWLMPAS